MSTTLPLWEGKPRQAEGWAGAVLLCPRAEKGSADEATAPGTAAVLCALYLLWAWGLRGLRVNTVCDPSAQAEVFKALTPIFSHSLAPQWPPSSSMWPL